ncbi:unnamed protein product [Ectocarpus sp. CCAP 1310/34]|nr:unnamed protein product [Ectocarpus sp. CCAP 1310/34]
MRVGDAGSCGGRVAAAPWLQRPRSRTKIPLLNEERKNRFRLFLVMMDLAKRAEDAGVAIVVDMGLNHRLTLAFDAQFEDKKMFLVLDDASYHHCFDEGLKVPESNSMKYDGCESFKEACESAGKAFEYNVEVRAEGSLPNAIGRNGVSIQEIASVTRRLFKKRFPEKLDEKAETYMREKGWRTETEWDGQEGGWKAAISGMLVEHAIGKMNEWINLYGGNLSCTIGSLVYPVAEYLKAIAEDEKEDGVEEPADDEWLGTNAEHVIEG